MKRTRREFIRYVGLVMASLAMAHCRSGRLPEGGPDWDAVRACWFALDGAGTDDYQDLQWRHQEALQALVDDGELDSEVAARIGAAFGQAVAHMQRMMATCYIALPPVFAPRADLMQQAAILEEAAAEGDIESATMAEVQAALERDIAWFDQSLAGQNPGALETVEVDSASAEAARILVWLLLGEAY